MSIGGGGDAKQSVTDYFASVHYGVCAGPVDAVTQVWYGEKLAWKGNVTGSQAVAIDKEGLFGGNKSEGGLVGTLEMLLGNDDQVLPASAVEVLRRNGATGQTDPQKVPAYRKILSVFMHGGSEGANIGSNTGYIKAFWFRVRRAPKGCPFEPTIIVNDMHLANPAAIIWECLANGVWGMGAPVSLIDADSFVAAAQTLANEKFGLAMMWKEQESIEDFVARVLDHIEGSLAVDPFTGLFRLKLVRDDYNVEDLPVFGPHNARLNSFERRAWGETTNEINVSWTNPENEQTETVTVHDTANVNLQGGTVVSETKNYSGIRDVDLALRTATRDLLASASALASAELQVNRQAWRILPGDVIALTWPAYDYERVPMRVSSVDYGKPGDSTITLSLLEDVFGMPAQTYVESTGSAWVNPAVQPSSLPYRQVTSVPYYVAVQKAGEAASEAIADTSDYDVAFGSHPQRGVFKFDLAVQQPDANGDLAWVGRGSANLSAYGALLDDLPAETTSVIPEIDDLVQGGRAIAGALAWIGPVDQTGELALIKAVDGTGYTLTRGVLDTVPKAWPASTPVWIIPAASWATTGIERAIGETASMRFLPTTALGRLAIGDASDVTGSMSGRLHRPYRPAKVQIAGETWPSAETARSFPLTVTWVGRNRLEETTLVNDWEDGAVAPEDGVTYTVELFGEDGAGNVTSYHVEDVGTATSYSIDVAADPPPAGAVYLQIEVRSVRDGLACWQAIRHRIRLFNPPSTINAVRIDLYGPGDLLAAAIDLIAPTDITATET